MKAECYTPGTYHVIVNPESFANASDCTDTDDDITSSPNSRSSRGTKSGSRRRTRVKSRPSSAIETEDPNVVILSRFEDALTMNSGYWKASRVSPPTSTPRSKSPEGFDELDFSGIPIPNQPLFLEPAGEVEDAKLLNHFRRVVWRHLVQAGSSNTLLSNDGINIPGADIFEREAAHFRPVSCCI